MSRLVLQQEKQRRMGIENERFAVVVVSYRGSKSSVEGYGSDELEVFTDCVIVFDGGLCGT